MKKKIFLFSFFTVGIVLIFLVISAGFWNLDRVLLSQAKFSEKQVKSINDSSPNQSTKEKGNKDIAKELAAIDDEISNQNFLQTEEVENENDLKSERYRIKQVNIDGGVVFASQADQHMPLEIYEVRSESIVSKKDDSFKLIINWKTNHPAISQLYMTSSNMKNADIIQEENYNVNHSIILSDLMPSTRYVYQVKATDKWGKEAISKKFGTFTNFGDAKSVFEIITEEFNKIFGWAIEK